ncbi:MAG TPA: response regulator transcription factor [Candidatus Eremiobacteraceae bacterium]|jgi:DNA-binding response OmpR family regulator
MDLHQIVTHEKKILIVDDEPQIVDVLERYLLDEGFKVCIARDGAEAVHTNTLERPDLVLMDLKLPTMNGLDAFRLIRSTSDVPVIMLTSRSDEVDRIVGLELGADDYITKPFSPREVVVRVKTVLRRTEDRGPDKREPTPDTSRASVRIGELEIDFREHEVRMREQAVPLTPTEFRVLETLAGSPGMTFTRAQLLDKIKGDDFEIFDRTLDRHIANLRHKIELDASNPRFIVTVFGVGYKISKRP